ncbi:MAG: hypothetical protein CMD22_03450 [Flavobacteriales bacterium]|nr:hypothetical protein [Flavobacteriales bacterium]
MKYYLEILLILFILSTNNLHSQCSIVVDTANISHIICPNGGAVGAAQIIQATYLNYSWQNVQTGVFFNTGGPLANTSRVDLEAGFYVITASSPYYSSCPSVMYSDTFEIRMPSSNIQSSPTQACPNECNVSLSLNLTGGIVPTNYTYSVDGLSSVTANQTFTNMCGGSHTYEVFADGQSCGIESFGISQFAPINLSTTVIDATCTQSGYATVNITGVGASALNNYCLSGPNSLYNSHQYSTITNVNFIGDVNVINNNTTCPNTEYFDFTSMSADVTPGNTYNLTLDLGTCNFAGMNGSAQYLEDRANIYIDWNIDGDFNDINELVGQVNPTQSPSTHTIPITVPFAAIPGQSRMRIVAQNYQHQNTNQSLACDYQSAYFGETEDYTIVVTGSVATPVTYLWSDGQTTQTATNLSAGTYTMTITDANGCTATETAIVGGPSNVSVTTSGSQTICSGAVPNSLSATSSSIGNYSWSPASDFVDPNVPNPIFSSGITSSTTYTCTFNSGGCVATDVVTITVNPLPTATLSTIPNPACLGESIILTASTSLPVNRYRFQFNNGGGWINMTSPGMSTSNPQIYNNISSTTQFRVKVKEDNGCNAGPWSPVVLVPISIVATQPINHN